MKTKKIFNVFMIAIAIATASIIAPSCDDEDDVMEVKYKTVKVESSEVYQTQDVVDVQITYNVVAEVSQGVERTESEWVNLIKKEINKEVNYVVKGLKFDDLSTEIFDDIYDSQNNKDYSLGVFKGISFVKIEKKDEDKKEIEEEDKDEEDIDKEEEDKDEEDIDKEEEEKDSEEEKDPSDNLDKVSVSATSTYMTKDNYAIVLSYDAELWETRVNEDKGVDEWTSFLKDVCEKVFKESVENVNWTDGKENFDNFMFGESGWGLWVANGFNGYIHESEMGVKYNCTFKIDEYPVEIVKNETLYSVSIEGVTLNNVQTQDYYKFFNVKINSCDVEYDDLGTVNEDEIKNLIISRINTEYEKYMNSVLLSERYKEYCETHEETKYRCLDFLDSELSNFESHLITIFNIENDHFTINKFELDKGINSTYDLMWLEATAEEHGYTDSTIEDDWVKMWS